MNGCGRHRDALVEMARGGPQDAAARGHAAGCAACAEALAMEEALTFELGRLAAADAGREPAPILVARLRESLHTRHGDDARRWPRAVSLGLAAALAVAVSLAALLAGRAVPPEDAPATTTAEFAPLVHGDALDDADALHLTRVRVPRSALPSLGWAGPMEDGPPVEAEVLVGQDGLARGIRFVASDGGVRR